MSAWGRGGGGAKRRQQPKTHPHNKRRKNTIAQPQNCRTTQQNRLTKARLVSEQYPAQGRRHKRQSLATSHMAPQGRSNPKGNRMPGEQHPRSGRRRFADDRNAWMLVPSKFEPYTDARTNTHSKTRRMQPPPEASHIDERQLCKKGHASPPKPPPRNRTHTHHNMGESEEMRRDASPRKCICMACTRRQPRQRVCTTQRSVRHTGRRRPLSGARARESRARRNVTCGCPCMDPIAGNGEAGGGGGYVTRRGQPHNRCMWAPRAPKTRKCRHWRLCILAHAMGKDAEAPMPTLANLGTPCARRDAIATTPASPHTTPPPPPEDSARAWGHAPAPYPLRTTPSIALATQCCT